MPAELLRAYVIIQANVGPLEVSKGLSITDKGATSQKRRRRHWVADYMPPQILQGFRPRFHPRIDKLGIGAVHRTMMSLDAVIDVVNTKRRFRHIGA